MTRREPHWDELRTFREVMRDGSLSGAARRLGVAQPTVGRHIDALEAALGVALFARSPRGLAPTDAATHLAPHVEAMAAASAALSRAAAGEASAESGVVRVTASEVIGCEVLPAIFASFRFAHPGVAIELAITNRNEDLSRREADIAVRMARPTQRALVAKRIGVTRVGLFAHRDYLARFGAPTSLADLAAHRMIGFDRDDRAARSIGGFAATLRRDAFGFRCDSDPALLAALRAGVGIGGAQEHIARRSPELVRLLRDEVAIPLDIWLVMHEDLKATPRARLLFAHLTAGLAAFVAGKL
jgi:DNA-binding transcriptional LysR family regulator